MHKHIFTSFLLLTPACDDPDPAASLEGEAEVEVVIAADAEGVVEVFTEPADSEEFEALDLAAPPPEPLAGAASSAFNTSWHSTKVSVYNGAGMPASKEVWFWGDAYHTNNNIDFYWARVEHRLYDYSNTHHVTTVTCTYSGDWATKYKLTCPAAAKGLSGWTVRTRLCADIKDDGKGTRCTPNAIAYAVW